MDNFEDVTISSEYDNQAYHGSSSSPPHKTSSSSPLPPSSSSSPPPASSSAPPSSAAHLDSGEDSPVHTSKNPVTAITTISSTSNDVKATPTGMLVSGTPDDLGSSPAEDGPANIQRNRPYSSSVISRSSNYSTRSKTSEQEIAKLYSYKDGSLDKAVETCKLRIFGHKNEMFKGAWLLTEINTWDMEFEKLFLLTDQTLYMVKYNFITRNPNHYRFIPLKSIYKLQIADLAYPSWTIMRKRDQGAVRIFSGNPPGLLERWNPYSVQTNILTITHHPTIYSRNETETATYNADDFAESLLTEATKCAKSEGRDLIMDESPVAVETYAGILALIHNQSKLGYNLDRNGISW